MGDIYTNPPQSRNEAILRATIDGTEYTDPPESRIEDLLLELKETIEEGGSVEANPEGVASETLSKLKVDETIYSIPSGGGGGGTSDYTELDNKPEINGVTLAGNKTAADLGLVGAETGKGLSSNDYTNADKAIVDGVTAALADKVDKVAGKGLSTNDYTDADKAIVDGVTSALSGKVDKVQGKGLSTNDFTDAAKDKLDGIAAGAQVNTIESITLNGSPISPDANKNVALTVITNAVDNLVNYYLKSETYTKTEVDTIAANIKNSRMEVVSSLPTTDIQTNVIYLVPKSSPDTGDGYDEYINLDGTTSGWELIGNTDIDLSGYVTTSDLNTALASYVTSTDLSTTLSSYATTAAAFLTSDTAETTLDDADTFPFFDTSATAKRKGLLSTLKAFLKTYFDTLYSTVTTLAGLSDVEISNPYNGQILQYDYTSGKWKNAVNIPVPEGATVTPTDDIQTWLNCANIWDKTYSTINQVLADNTTLLALISNNNAADYMKRSTTWTSSVVANSTAMTDIGVNDYCASVLLADSTWRNAICNSTYFESVLNVKVPTMTSDNTPYGVVSQSGYTDTGYGWKAFDNDNSTRWGIPETTSTEWIMYGFDSSVKINKCYILFNTTGDRIKARSEWIKIEGTNNGSDFIELYTYDTQNIADSANTITLQFPDNTDYSYIRLSVKKKTTSAFGITTLQFYGRT